MISLFEKLKNRIKSFDKHDWIILAFLLVVIILGLYLSIGMTVSAANGYTLFGDSSYYDSSEAEIYGPTSSDILVITVFWILTALCIATFVFLFFFKKKEKKEVVLKEIVDGKTVIVKEEQVEEEEEVEEKEASSDNGDSADSE